MLEIDEAVIDRIENDATMISLMSIDASDNRIYAWYPAIDIVYTKDEQEVAIIFRNSLGGRPFNWSYPSQIPNITYFFRILSINQLKLRQCSERLIELFDMTSIETEHWGVKWIELSGAADGMNEGGPTHPIVSKNVTFAFSVVVKKDTV